MSAVQQCVKFANPINNALSVHEYVNHKMSCDNLIVPDNLKKRESSESFNDIVHHDNSVSNKVHSNHVSFMHTYKVVYLGYAVLDRRYTLPMLPWVIAEIKRHGVQNAEDVFLEVTESCLKAINNKSKKLVFEHKLTTISKFSQTAQDPGCFTYMTREVINGPCAYHVFQADDECTVLELFTMLREMSKEMAQQQNMIYPIVSSNNSIAPDSIMTSGQHYEVMYLGRIKVSSKRAPPSFIDDAVEKFRVYELEKLRSQQKSSSSNSVSAGSRQRHGSGASISSLPHSLDTIPQINENQLSSQMNASVPSSSSREHLTPHSGDSSSSENSQCGSLDEIHHERKYSASSDIFQFPSVNSLNDSSNFLKSPTLSVSSTFSHEDNLLSPLLLTKNNLIPNSSLIPSTQSLDTSSCTNIVEDLQNIHLADILRGRVRSCSGDIPRATKQTSLPAYRTRVRSGGSSDMHRPYALTVPSSSVPQHRNRTMLFLIGRLEICLIGMDKKQFLLNKTFNDIAHCSQGVKYFDHFGFICRETTVAGADCYAGYIFRCQTEQVVDEIMQSLKLAFKKAHQDYQHDGPQKTPNVPRVSICEGCPMQWFHRLCSDVDGLPAEKSHCNILLKLHTLPDCDREKLMQKCDTADVNSLQEQNEVLMMLLREFCEQKQIKHVHVNNGNHYKTDYAFMKEKSASSKLDNFRQKAKKSLSSSFETFRKLKHRDDSRECSLTSISDHSISALRQTKSEAIEEVVYREGSYDGPASPRINEQSPLRPRSSTFSTTHEVRKASQRRAAEKKKESPQSKSPIMNIFMKVGHSDKTPTSSGDEVESVSKKGSWRQAIFHRVQTPVQTPKRVVGISESKTNTSSSDEEEKVYTKKSREQLRALWKKAILEQILLIRMEKENKKLQVSQDAVSYKRMKLDYEDITPCLKDIAQKWENLLNCSENSEICINKDNLLELVKTGVPRNKRGEIWQFLAEQYNAWRPPAHLVSDIDLSTPYEELIGQLTSHQHAILIDLGRTFPSHPFYCQPLGPGQLSLFNLLKAYSLLDKEVGYCQGLSFVAGILLLHIPEERAFDMMKHILFCLGLRRQYKPDMVALQIQMYQLSRLMHDNYREVYDHLEKYDIAPTLYAAPWFLTLYASQFPMGFVSRLFDILFLQGLDTIFKVALILIGNHKDHILQCHGFEAIMEFLKVTLPSMNPIEMERVFSQVFTLDIHKQLNAYEVEYHVLREEMIYSPSRTDTAIVQKLETVNRNLKVQNMELMEQLQVAYSTIDHLESSETSYKSTIQRLEARVNSLEDEKEALLHSLSIMKKRLQILETACLASDAQDNATDAILDSHHPPSFRVVYDLAGTEKEEEQQLKSLIRNFCKDQGELPKDICKTPPFVENSVNTPENRDHREEFPRNRTEVFSNISVPDFNPIHCGSKHQLRVNIEKERMRHNL